MKIQGAGEIFEGEKKRAKVQYELNIKHETLVVEDFKSYEEKEGKQFGDGLIYNVQDGKINLIEDLSKMLTLHMDNGKKQDFFIRDSDANSGGFSILLSGKTY